MGEGTRTPDSWNHNLVPSPLNPEENGDSQKVGARGGALESEIGISDPDLAVVIERWESLPTVVQAGIVAMVKAAGDGAEG